MVKPTEHMSEQEVNRYLNAVLDSLNEFVVRWQPDGIRTYVNQAYCNYYKLSREQALGSSFFPHIAQEDLAKVKQRIAKLSINQPSSTDIHRVYSPEGGIGWQEWTDTALFDEQGKLIGYQSVGRDISEQKQNEQELIAYREQLEKLVEARTTELTTAYQELESFSYSVSHDLRAPLRSVAGFCAILAEDYLFELDEEGQGYIQRITASVQQMNEIIEALLNLSDIMRTVIAKNHVDLTALAQEIAQQLKERKPDRVVEFIIQENMTVEADAKLMRIVLENLLGNAWKYSKNTPNASIQFGITRKENQLVYFIRDNGVGFDMKSADKMFRAFVRLHSASEFQGTGIGLTTVHRIISRHGGAIWTDAKVGQGATFYFTLD